MAQDLQDLLDEARGLMNDVDSDLITDRELKKWLNEGLVHLSLKGQMLEDIYQFQTVADQHEYGLPYQSGDVKEVWHYTGSRQNELTKKKPKDIILGSRQTGTILTAFYSRLNSAILMSQDSTNALTKSTRGSRSKDKKPRFVLGLFPTPSSAQTITVVLNVGHPHLRNSRDEILLPFEYHYGPVAYALHKCYAKEKAYAEARFWSEVWNDMVDMAKDAAIGEGREGHGEVIRQRDSMDFTNWQSRINWNG